MAFKTEEEYFEIGKTKYCHDAYLKKIDLLEGEFDQISKNISEKTTQNLNVNSSFKYLRLIKIASCLYGDTQNKLILADIHSYIKAILHDNTLTAEDLKQFENAMNEPFIQKLIADHWIGQTDLNRMKDMLQSIIILENGINSEELHRAVDSIIDDCENLRNTIKNISLKMTEFMENVVKPLVQSVAEGFVRGMKSAMETTTQNITTTFDTTKREAYDLKAKMTKTYWNVLRRQEIDDNHVAIFLMRLEPKTCGELKRIDFDTQYMAKIVITKDTVQKDLIDMSRQILILSDYFESELNNNEKMRDYITAQKYTLITLKQTTKVSSNLDYDELNNKINSKICKM